MCKTSTYLIVVALVLVVVELEDECGGEAADVEQGEARGELFELDKPLFIVFTRLLNDDDDDDESSIGDNSDKPELELLTKRL